MIIKLDIQNVSLVGQRNFTLHDSACARVHSCVCESVSACIVLSIYCGLLSECACFVSEGVFVCVCERENVCISVCIPVFMHRHRV